LSKWANWQKKYSDCLVYNKFNFAKKHDKKCINIEVHANLAFLNSTGWVLHD
jgi:hypothetical protein